MEPMSIETDLDLEGKNQFSRSKPDRKPSGDDPVSDWLMKIYYSLQKD